METSHDYNDDDDDYDDPKDADGDDDCYDDEDDNANDDHDHVAGAFYDNIGQIKERLSSKLKMEK